MRHVGITHGRQFTGGVFAGVSMQARAVGDDLSTLVGQQLRCEFLDPFGRDVQGRDGPKRFLGQFEGAHPRHNRGLVDLAAPLRKTVF
jgi:hypothetical protein